MFKPDSSQLFRLGLWYGAYRVLVSICLFLIILLNISEDNWNSENSVLIFWLISTYLLVCIFQFIGYTFFKKNKFQVLLFSLFDICALSIFTMFNGQADLYTGTLFIVSIFVLNLVEKNKLALFLTSSTIILTLLPTILNVYLDGEAVDFAVLLSGGLLTLLFIIIAFIGNVISRAYDNLIKQNEKQEHRLEQLIDINNIIINKIETGYIVADQSLNVLSSNPAANIALQLEGSSKKVNLNERFPDLAKKITSILKSKVKNDFEMEVFNNSLQISVSGIDDENHYCLITLESSEKINSRVQYLKLAELGQLSASIAHEIRNPLSTIVQANQLIAGSDFKEVNKYTEIIKKQTARIDLIIKSTLNMAKGSGFNKIAINLDEFFYNLIYEDLFDLKDNIALFIDRNLIVIFDENHLKQIFINLIRNAIRHNNSEVSNVIHINGFESNDQVFVDVVDFGDGVTESNIQNLFQPFFTTELNGTGIGLYMCKSLCQANNSDIVYMKKNGNPCFRVNFKTFELE